jgi:hypothetical protein
MLLWAARIEGESEASEGRIRLSQLVTAVRVERGSLANRSIMAPMTRSRANLEGTPGELAEEGHVGQTCW